ncbi:hypothetical protein [Lacrimispora amygdalina]|uniref:hypothetical protein n=1 Tax=Lacrimispora amygdalina TaxID=253257 RepID=UPI000BE2601C|nr:hypothetical protein [Lacrimispora amygdalina]
MKFEIIEKIVEAKKYEFGMEDGIDFFDIGGRFICNMTAEQLKSEDHPRAVKKPYIIRDNRKWWIPDNAYIITFDNGEKFPCEMELFNKLYALQTDM